MLYKGTAKCPKCGEFDWQIVEGEKNSFVIGANLITKCVKTYDKKLKLIIANCPKCGKRIEIEYHFNGK